MSPASAGRYRLSGPWLFVNVFLCPGQPVQPGRNALQNSYSGVWLVHAAKTHPANIVIRPLSTARASPVTNPTNTPMPRVLKFGITIQRHAATEHSTLKQTHITKMTSEPGPTKDLIS